MDDARARTGGDFLLNMRMPNLHHIILSTSGVTEVSDLDAFEAWLTTRASFGHPIKEITFQDRGTLSPFVDRLGERFTVNREKMYLLGSPHSHALRYAETNLAQSDDGHVWGILF